MRPVRAAVLVLATTVALALSTGGAAAQTTTTTIPPGGIGTLPVTGAADGPDEAAGGELARTGIELVPVVNASIGMIAAGFALLVAADFHASRRRRSLWTY